MLSNLNRKLSGNVLEKHIEALPTLKNDQAAIAEWEEQALQLLYYGEIDCH